MRMIKEKSERISPGSHDVLRLLYENDSMRQSDIARILGITKSACNQHCRRLVNARFSSAENGTATRVGRPAQSWHINQDENCFLGLSFSSHAKELSGICIDFSGTPVFRRVEAISSEMSAAELLEKLENLIMDAVRFIRKRRGRILQIFVGVNGTISPDGTIIHDPFLPGMDGLNFEAELGNTFGIPFFSDTTNYGAMHYMTADLPAESTALLLFWDLGVSAMVIAGHEVLNFAAIPSIRNRGLWNPGHIPVVRDGRPCYCGKKGCLEAYTGGKAIFESHPEFGVQDFDAMLRKAPESPEIRNVIARAAKLLAESQYSLLELFGVDHIIVAGAFASVFDLWQEAFRAGLETMRLPEEAAQIQLSARSDQEEAHRIGAALMARHYYFYPEMLRKCRGVYKPATRENVPAAPVEKSAVQAAGL